jgi:hypothetical protein
MRIAPVVSLLLGLCLQPVSSIAQVASSPARQAVKPTPAATAEAPAPRKQARSPKSKSDATPAMRQAVQQVADQFTAEKRAARIRDLLTQAQLDYEQGRLFEPADNNATTRYKEILTLDPTQPQALAATQRIVAVLVAEAEHAAIAGDQARTLQYILQLRALQPNNLSLAGLEARYQSLLTNPVVLSARQQERYSRSAQNIEEAYDKLKNQPLGLETMDQVVRRYDRAADLVAQPPGLPKLEDRIILAFPAAVRAELTAADPRSAYLVAQIARKRGWFSEELEALEVRAIREIEALPPFPSKSRKP